MEQNYKQVIIVRKDLNMTPGKLAAQVSHASMAFLTRMISNSAIRICRPGYNEWYVDDTEFYSTPGLYECAEKAKSLGLSSFYATFNENKKCYEWCDDPDYYYKSELNIEKGIYDNWINNTFTKIIVEAKNKNQLLKAVDKAKELGLVENKDYFLIKDNCYTELEPEEIDENGIGRTLTCIGFKPMDATIIDQISKKYQLLH